MSIKDVQVSSIHDVLEQYRNVAFDEYDKGAHFERLMQAFLQTEPQYEALYDEVWRWAEYPARGTRTDTGIDLVARNRDTGDLTIASAMIERLVHHADGINLKGTSYRLKGHSTETTTAH